MVYMNYAIMTHCVANNITISAAESCTGGSFIASLVAVPGASAVIHASFVTYANDAKIRYAHVSQDLLDQHGAVSEEVAVAMARGVREETNSSIGVGITGIAGPSGGSKEKPVGLVYICVNDNKNTRVQQYNFSGNRAWIQQQTVQAAQTLLWELLNDL
jgi:PncC family amidohydrolase